MNLIAIFLCYAEKIYVENVFAYNRSVLFVNEFS